MGYELTFHYHEEISKNEYNKEELKTKVLKIGSPYDEIPLEAVASRIMSQLARRNILITDVEIYEYTKKKISFKEASDGILIKNKKFSFDDGVNLISVDVPCDPCEEQGQPQASQLVSNQQLLQQLLTSLLAGNQNMISNIMKDNKGSGVNLASQPMFTSGKQSSLRHEIFNPLEREMVVDCQRRGLAFTLGKRYPIINERMAPNQMAGMMYTTVDNNGKRHTLSDKFFTPSVSNLEYAEIFEEEFVPVSNKKKGSDGLDWSGTFDEGEPLSIR